MKCTNCGYELEEGKLYCEKCGQEIRIVPDFEPEIEASISGALAGLAEDFSSKEETGPLDGKPEKKPGRKVLNKKQKTYLWAVMAAVCLLLSAGISLFFSYHTGKASYQLDRAQACADKGDYSRAVAYALKAVDLDRTNMETRNLLGEYYALNDEVKNAKTTFQDIIRLDAENEAAYENLISLLEKEKDYEAINTLIRSSSSAKIINSFIKYIANTPEFSHEQGTYDEAIRLKLTSNTTGTIYYTLDGTKPGQDSDVYKAPLFLENGIYTIKAVFVNDYGISSDVAAKTYQIDSAVPGDPEISLASGAYTEPQMITVRVPKDESVYYTLDGTNPTRNSIPYVNPIALPMGKSTYKFISYSKDDVASNIVKRDYEFSFQAAIGVQDAVNLLVLGLKDRGVLLENDGTLAGKSGHNIYIISTAISINGNSYYLVVEYYEDLTGADTKTGNMYCVDANTGQLFKATVGNDGYYSVVSF